MSSHTFERLQSALLGEAAALRMPPHNLAEVEAFLPVAHAELAPAAVLCGLVPRPDGLQVLLTKRAEHLRHHAGQISFPGGRMEAGDASPLQTALREAQEEVGLQPQHVEVIGQLPVYTTGTGFHVTPVVALVQPPFSLQPNPGEVDAVFEVPLAFLMNPANHRRHAFDWQGRQRQWFSMPYHEPLAEGSGTVERFIWGATAGMLRNLYRFLLANEAGWESP